MEKETILSTGISIATPRTFVREVIRLTEADHSSYICFANVHMLIEAYRNPEFRDTVNNAELVAADGRPLSLFLQVFKGIRQKRICGMDLLPILLCEAERQGKSVFFYGSTAEVLNSMRERAGQEFPRLRVAGQYSPPFRPLEPEEKQEISHWINSLHPDLLFVSLGCPKQEKWMAEFQDKIKSCMLGLGQAFTVYAGKEKRLPLWMRNLSLEWVYRLYLEPRRLWKRYLYGNSYFLMLVLKHALNQLIAPVKKFARSSNPANTA
ncbi:Putative UDP-N-acetyl-D-mannosaminuronic acid transferase [Fulvivirga imtechensis AK7]|uniref:Putative UDP-N-acetyl-D-mannosaminuronic acid transferase n=1 Tax=Fulvivirga imtechensis AK7 TaxID=1237149 RepID=L8JRN4_9BACT|nr:WecB/TagA/CpsF family glycosyltransferase [Fulvivirga imtechensis]ELR71631.1 Putative UDP-N-acetyl-D-mannosaminuronic acid transferase [Fulvivirga imtechensis AK7]